MPRPPIEVVPAKPIDDLTALTRAARKKLKALLTERMTVSMKIAELKCTKDDLDLDIKDLFLTHDLPSIQYGDIRATGYYTKSGGRLIKGKLLELGVGMDIIQKATSQGKETYSLRITDTSNDAGEEEED
jgi:hypothetical protein